MDQASGVVCCWLFFLKFGCFFNHTCLQPRRPSVLRPFFVSGDVRRSLGASPWSVATTAPLVRKLNLTNQTRLFTAGCEHRTNHAVVFGPIRCSVVLFYHCIIYSYALLCRAVTVESRIQMKFCLCVECGALIFAASEEKRDLVLTTMLGKV